MRLLKQEATNRMTMVAAVTGMRALVKRAAAGSRTTISTTKMVNPNQTNPSWNMFAIVFMIFFSAAEGRDNR
jgi:hypothetical protein